MSILQNMDAINTVEPLDVFEGRTLTFLTSNRSLILKHSGSVIAEM